MVVPPTSVRRRARRPRLVVVAVAVLVAVSTSACLVNQHDLSAMDRLAPGAGSARTPTLTDVAYGPEPLQRLDVYRADGVARGTIVYFHSGGWIGGDKSVITPLLAHTVELGWDLVSVDYRLAGQGVRAAEMLSDADRAVRHVRAHAGDLGLDVHPLLVAGSSSGAHLAAMLTVRPGAFVASELPGELLVTSPVVDGLIDVVGPSDLTTFWAGGEWAESLSAALLGCSASGLPYSDGNGAYGPCPADEATRFSPAFWAALIHWLGGSLPPAFLAYGAQDTLVRAETQASPLVGAWEGAAGYGRAWYSLVENVGHSVDGEVNETLFEMWLDRADSGGW